MQYLWNTFIYEPIYNTLIAIAHIVGNDVGIAVILVTVLIRLILLPLSKKSIVGQYKMKALQPKIDKLKAQGLSKQDEAAQLMVLYKQEKINPFSGCLYLLVQLPILFALYFVFFRGVSQPEHLYSFLSLEDLKTSFLGLIDITKPFLPFAILAGLSQALQAFFAPTPAATTGGGFQAQFTKSLALQTKYILPIIIIFIASRLAAAVALYWIVTNIFSVLQELYMRKKYGQNIARV